MYDFLIIFFNTISDKITLLNDFIYTYILTFMLIFTGFYFSFATKFIQLKAPLKALKVFKQNKTSKGISPFESFALTTAARVGIGNIIGISIAVSIGGASAIFWMWIVAFLGGASAFAESTLAQLYKTTKNGVFIGGPAYYIKNGLGLKWLGNTFAICLICADLIGFNGVLAHSIFQAISDLLSEFSQFFTNFNPTNTPNIQTTQNIANTINPTIFTHFFDFSHPSFLQKIILATIITLLAGLIFAFGIKASLFFIPFMAIFYLLLSVFIFFTHLDKFSLIFNEIFSHIFDINSTGGGFLGSALIIGLKRGLFSNEAGMGSAPNAAASASVKHPCEQGFVQSFSVLIDLLVCTASGVLVLCSDVFWQQKEGFQDGILIKLAMSEYFGDFGFYFISFFILIFGFSSFFGNYFYSLSNLKFLTSKKIFLYFFNILAIFCVFTGCLMKFNFVWNLADFLMAIMCFINLFAILLLSPKVLNAIKSYDKNN